MSRLTPERFGHDPGALAAFLSALGQADAVMAASDEEWQALRPLTGAENDAVLAALRDRFRQGLVADWPPSGQVQAGKLFTLLDRMAGPQLTGGAPAFPAGTFWTGGGR